MTEQVTPLQQVSAMLNQQKIRLQHMLETLGHELNAIKTRNGEALVTIASDKEAQLAEIREADNAFNSETSVELINTTPELTQLKQEINELLEQCQKQNEVCYLTATQNQIAIEQVKNLLIGGSKNTTYNEQGQTNTYGSLGKGIKA